MSEKSIFLSISGKLINAFFLCSRRYNFLPSGAFILCFRHGDFSLERRSENRLIKSGKVCYNNTPEREGVVLLVGAEMEQNVASQSRKTR